MEACGSAHHWVRVARAHGHRMTLLPPQYVRPSVRRNKTDRTDAEALLEAVRSGQITPVTVGCTMEFQCGANMPTRESVVRCDPDVLGGTPVFAGTRVPVKNLLDYLAAGDSLDRFLDHFPSITREQAVAALEVAKDLLTSRATPAR